MGSVAGGCGIAQIARGATGTGSGQDLTAITSEALGRRFPSDDEFRCSRREECARGEWSWARVGEGLEVVFVAGCGALGEAIHQLREGDAGVGGGFGQQALGG